MAKDNKNIPVETLLVGSLYKQPDLYVEYYRFIVSKYDFTDASVKFFYDNFALMYETFTQTFTQTTVNAWMCQEPERLNTYKAYGGYKTISSWMDLAVTDDFKNYFSVAKKYSLLREYQRNGFPAERILEFDNFEKLTAKDIYRLIRSKADKIFTIIDGEEESHVINTDMTSVVSRCLIAPSMGIPYPFKTLNEVLKGLMSQTLFCTAMASNEGKTRFMVMLVAYVSLVLKQKTLILLNEMTEESIKHCLITTVVNNEAFSALHGINLCKNEKEITLGLYRDEHGKLIYRKTDKSGQFAQSEQEFIEQIGKCSDEYRKVMQIAKWVEDQMEGLIYVKELSRYDDATLEFEIRKHAMVHNIKYIFYDTLKSDDSAIGDWAALKLSTTKLKQLMNELKLYGYGSIQLTDDTHFTEPLHMTSNNIASCKQIKHLVDQLLLCKKIEKESYRNYQYIQSDPDWGGECLCDLSYKDVYYCFLVDKNRKGSKTALLFRVDLDLNVWVEVGELVKKQKDKDMS